MVDVTTITTTGIFLDAKNSKMDSTESHIIIMQEP